MITLMQEQNMIQRYETTLPIQEIKTAAVSS